MSLQQMRKSVKPIALALRGLASQISSYFELHWGLGAMQVYLCFRDAEEANVPLLGGAGGMQCKAS
jgi:hypothetical protein